MSEFDFAHLLGLEYITGKQDCYSVLRQFCRERYNLRLPNYARPERFWEDPELDLYSMYQQHGFETVIDRPMELGDVLLMPLRTSFPSHAAMLVNPTQILHHIPGRLSCLDPVRPRWASMATRVIRHPSITAVHQSEVETVSLHEVINARVLRDPEVQAAIAEQVGPGA